ncbi:MAG: thiamine-phosphate kinase [Gammaproteobacteria bacterium]|nr:MAG: thiamine-phosphate kinase [Gammaproteobacteria bacterium]
MALSEFNLIERFFCRQKMGNGATRIGIGDDGAILSLSSQSELVVSTDTLVEGVHFLPRTDPGSLGHKALAVNLSDLAAMGAEPKWVFLSLTLPNTDENWLEAFSSSFLSLADRYSIELVGGDTTRGPLSLSVTVLGLVEKGKGLLRSGAKVGDKIFVTGFIGDAGLGLQEAKKVVPADLAVLERYLKPVPRVQAGRCLEGVASSCIDVSDGLAADLGHILNKSGVGASIQWEKLPLSSSVKIYVKCHDDWVFPLTSGDDYELCFTVPKAHLGKLAGIQNELSCTVTEIGEIEARKGLQIYLNGKKIELGRLGYQHF